MPNSLRQLRNNRGAIIFFALWALVILTILAIGISSRVASEIRLSKYLEERAVSLYLAKASLNQTIIELEKDETPDYDTLYELQKERQKQLGNGSFKFNLVDEESLININTVSLAIIERLPGLNPDLAKKIFESDLKPFQLKEELLLVEGITEEIYSEFKDLITTYTEGRVNINTASATVLEVLGLEDDLIEIILNYRKGEDGEAATQDDREFESVATILDSLRKFTLLTLEQELQITELISQNLLCVRGKFIKLNIEAHVLGKAIKNYNVILERTPKSKIKFWQEK